MGGQTTETGAPEPVGVFADIICSEILLSASVVVSGDSVETGALGVMAAVHSQSRRPQIERLSNALCLMSLDKSGQMAASAEWLNSKIVCLRLQPEPSCV